MKYPGFESHASPDRSRRNQLDFQQFRYSRAGHAAARGNSPEAKMVPNT